MQENEIKIEIPSENLKCLKCKFGLVLNPYRTKCARYREGKPSDVYYKGADCPFFEQAILRKENN